IVVVVLGDGGRAGEQDGQRSGEQQRTKHEFHGITPEAKDGGRTSGWPTRAWREWRRPRGLRRGGSTHGKRAPAGDDGAVTPDACGRPAEGYCKGLAFGVSQRARDTRARGPGLEPGWHGPGDRGRGPGDRWHRLAGPGAPPRP